eukprot:g39586.t1
MAEVPEDDALDPEVGRVVLDCACVRAAMNDMAAVAMDSETLLENSEEEERADRDESQRCDGEGTGEEFTLDLVRQLGGTK